MSNPALCIEPGLEDLGAGQSRPDTPTRALPRTNPDRKKIGVPGLPKSARLIYVIRH